jgi:hypothetical protein
VTISSVATQNEVDIEEPRNEERVLTEDDANLMYGPVINESDIWRS